MKIKIPVSIGSIRFLLQICLLLAVTSAVRAHDSMESYAVAQPVEKGLRLQFTLSAPDAIVFLNKADPSAKMSPNADIGTILPSLRALAPEVFDVTADGIPLVVLENEMTAAVSPDGQIDISLIYSWPERGPLRFKARFLERMPPDHSTYLSVLDAEDRLLASAVPTLDEPLIEAPLPSRIALAAGTSTLPSTSADTAGAEAAPSHETAKAVVAHKPTFGEFLKLGIGHILTGYDHLLFLGGLLVACRYLGSMVKIVTFFTLAHSITLALAALRLVQMSPRIVEPLIAATIMFVAVENLLRDDEPRHRWVLTFAFGLVHGFGFASALRDMGIGRDGVSIALPLFSFNLGVELGQLLVVALVLPLLLALRKRPAFVRFALPVFSVGIGLAGAFWFCERVFIS